MKISDKTRSDCIDYMANGIEYVIKNFGDRDPGSTGERKAIEYMAGELEGMMGTKSKIEEFKLNPGSFFGWIPVLAISFLLSYILYWYIPILSMIFVVFGFIPMLTQFILYLKFTDFLYKEKTSANAIISKMPKGEVKRRVYLCGHADATWEWTILRKFKAIGFNSTFAMSAVGAVYLFIASLIATLAHFEVLTLGVNFKLIVGLINLIFIPFWIALFWFSNSKVVVPGANDNLSACYLSMAVAKAFKEDNIELENTEFGVLLIGSEEAGLRGSKAFCDLHKDDFNDVETIFLNFETLRELDCLSIYNRDLNGIVKTDIGVCQLLKEAGLECGRDVKFATVTVGATDSAAFAQAGMKSACLSGLSHMLKDYYHTRYDNYDNLDKECLGVAFDIAVKAVENYDKNGLPKVDKLTKSKH